MTVDSDDFQLPLIDLQPFLLDPASPEAVAECKRAAEALYKYGALVIKDPRVTESHNDNFLNLLESYFGQPQSQIMQDARPEFAYQVGVTPELTETPRCTFDPACSDLISGLGDAHKPHIPTGPDPKWRYFWRIGSRPSDTKFPGLNAPEVVPAGFRHWTDTMNGWGSLLRSAVNDLAGMAAVGFGLPADAFTSRCSNGPHLLAPTASDLCKYSQLDTIFAGFHYDLNFLTIHGKSRFPGLSIWTREGHKLPVKVPNGCLLVQAGKQLEYLTAGYVMAGYHEVVVMPETLKAVELAKANNKSLWRISSTLFFHVASDQTLEPLGDFAHSSKCSQESYPPILAGHQVQRELESINLSKSKQ